MQTNETIEALEQAIAEAQQTLAQLKAVPQQSLATTMDEVVKELKPIQYISNLRNLKQGHEYECIYSLTGTAAEKVQAYTDVLNICTYLNENFEGDGDRMWFITLEFDIDFGNFHATKSIYYFTSRNAAEYALKHFKGVFEKFYQLCN